VALFTAPITAGLLLSTPDGRALHSVSAYLVFAAAVLYVVTAILVWRPSGGSPRPILYAVGFLGLTLAQIALGIAQVKNLHVPLIVLMFGLSRLQLNGIWPRRPRPRRVELLGPGIVPEHYRPSWLRLP
jgi:hypothetical protein